MSSRDDVSHKVDGDGEIVDSGELEHEYWTEDGPMLSNVTDETTPPVEISSQTLSRDDVEISSQTLSRDDVEISSRTLSRDDVEIIPRDDLNYDEDDAYVSSKQDCVPITPPPTPDDEESAQRLRKFQSSLVSSLLRRALEIRRDKSLPQSYLYLKNEIIWEFGAEAWYRNKDRIVKLLRSEALRDKESRIRQNKRVLRYTERLVKKIQHETGRRSVDHNYVVKRVQVKYGKQVFERNRERVLQMLRDKSALYRVRRFSSQMEEKQLSMNENSEDEEEITPACLEAREIARKLLERGVLSQQEYDSMWFVKKELEREEEEEEETMVLPLRKPPITSSASFKERIIVSTQLISENSSFDEDDSPQDRDLLHTARQFRLNREIEQRAPEPFVEIDRHGAPINACVIVDEMTVLSASDSSALKLWSTQRGHQPQCLVTLNKHQDAVNGCASNRRLFAASASDDETVRVTLVGKSL